MFFSCFHFVYHMFLQFFILFAYNLFKYGKCQCSIKAASISPSFTIVFILRYQTLDLDIESLVIGKLIHQQSKWKTIANEWRLCFHFFSNHLLLLFMHLKLFFELIHGLLVHYSTLLILFTISLLFWLLVVWWLWVRWLWRHFFNYFLFRYYENLILYNHMILH